MDMNYHLIIYEYDLLRKNKYQNDALILQLKSNNKAKEVEKQELKKY